MSAIDHLGIAVKSLADAKGFYEKLGLKPMPEETVAAEQVRLLQANGVDEFHFYTLNRPDLTFAIAHVLGVRAQASPTA